MIDNQLLIASPTLQDELVDKCGNPLSNGVVTCYQDNSRTTLKNWYYQSGSPTNYTYVTLPNPMTLSAAGTIVDVNGADTIPFWYPYDDTNNNSFQPYFVTVYDQFGTLQFTRQNFPFIAENAPGPTPIINNPTWENYVINNRFWRNVGSFTPTVNPSPASNTNMLTWTTQYNSSGTVFAATLAPSQHDGFSMPDLNYIKNNQSATEVITFAPFPQATTPALLDDITPEYYIQHQCTIAGSSETLKVYQFPISFSTQTLLGVKATVKIQAINIAGAPNGALSLYIYQFLGTGATSPSPQLVGSISVLSTAWTSYDFQFTFPVTGGLTLSGTGDDALYLQIGVPLDATCNIGFTLPSIYLSETFPSNEFQTYDQIDTVINSPRTGDLRMSLNSFYPFGWLPMNGGTIGGAASNATARNNADVWQLFYMLWTSFGVYGFNVLPIYTSASSPTTYGASAYADFIVNKQLALTRSMGAVLMGTVPFSSLLFSFKSTFTGSSTTITPTYSMGLFSGAPIMFTGTTTLAINIIYYVGNWTGTTFQVFTTFNNAITLASPQTVDASGTVSIAPAGTVLGEYNHVQLATELAAHTHTTAVPSGTGGQVVTAGTNAINNVSQAVTSSTAGSSAPFNVTQPSVLTNIYIKL